MDNKHAGITEDNEGKKKGMNRKEGFFWLQTEKQCSDKRGRELIEHDKPDNFVR